jgi:hypothetical protein
MPAPEYRKPGVTVPAPRRPYTCGVLIQLVVTALAVWFALAPESARGASIALYGLFGLTIDPPRAIFFRLGGLTWLLILASTWMERP